MSIADLYLTRDGVAKLTTELERLKKVDRPAVITRIKEARELGDLSENAEYHAAREEQGLIEGRIEEIETLLKKAKIIEHKNQHGVVEVGSKVKVSVVEVDGDAQDAYNDEFTIVGSTEADPSSGLISAESPLGAALLGIKKGATVTVPVPDDGELRYKVLAID